MEIEMTHTIGETEDAMRDSAELAGDTAAELARTKDDLMREFRSLINEGEELMRQTSTLSGDALAMARERFRARLADARLRVNSLSDVARDRGREYARVADDYVHESPWVSVGAAAGLGFLLGVLVARR
jgi:ElaB/YqjD/DUF883 family membrane-anchored ribosome-binding protein